MSRLALIPLVALMPVLAACSQTIDSDEAEDTISTGTLKRTGSKIASVDCPSDQTAQKGKTFTCRVVAADGTHGDVLVTVTEDSGKVTFQVPFRNTRATERSMATTMTRRSRRSVSVDCPDIIARRKGVVFECATASAKKRGHVRAMQIDDDANVHYRQVEGK